VLGRPSWETRFVAAALEEAGWSVALRVPVAPGQVVQQGDAALDTAHVGAVVALDSSAAPLAASIARFVRAGGGLVATASAVRGVPAIAALAPGGTGRAIAASLAEVGDAVDRRALALVAVAPLDADAVALERRDGAVALAARRVGTGRVVQVGYDETWRWRMSGGDSGVVAHRRWWSSLVAGVARAPVVRRADAGVPDPAPLAALVEALGPPRARPASSLASARFASPGAGVLAAILALLLVEWFSRRLRGAR
ncbi:MAG TPA: hypothetical protein VEA99_15090, partial [Gemmatimonadaceae bacterium]|nr:hypothetical protein [Gemmatimonadaceae bacterium]